MNKPIKSALISVYFKDGLTPIVQRMHDLGITLYSTGGTQTFIEDLGIPVIPVETLTGYPSIFGGRVKTLHPGVLGGILYRRNHEQDEQEAIKYGIQAIDCVVVDLYPFEDTVAAGGSADEIIEKIDIGGIALIRGTAKNFQDTLIIPSVNHYAALQNILNEQQGETTLEQRKHFAKEAFEVSSHYDSAIYTYFKGENNGSLRIANRNEHVLRYGENPHQKGSFYGDLDALFTKLNGKELSYNNLLDVEAAVQLIDEFKNCNPTFAILKHNNACGLATRTTMAEAYDAAFACDSTSAFGGVLISNGTIDLQTAEKINSLFCEVIIAPNFSEEAVHLLKSKPNRIILIRKQTPLLQTSVRSILNGYLVQDKDDATETEAELKLVTEKGLEASEINDLIFANKLVKHTKSNTIVLAKNETLIASGTGQTSRVDALNQAIEKARHFGFSLEGTVMASDAFFPFPDCVEIANQAGICGVIQPGGSIKDQLSIDYCNTHGLAMYMTGVRHFKH
ncbi:MAG: bifunctional phosphoribosylaminoimidazolecarboxamide formyltransferase/IMP cyclohydrolase [Bacteroidota bacterium]